MGGWKQEQGRASEVERSEDWGSASEYRACDI